MAKAQLESEKPWQPLSVYAVSALFAGGGFPWWLAGGHAIELAVGRHLRSHGDIDVLLLHRDHSAVRSFLRDWDCWAADPPGRLRPWPHGEELPLTVHDVWCRASASKPWCLQLMFDAAQGDEWVSRRHDDVRLPLSMLGRTSADNVCYVTPEVLLFYKAKTPRAKDEIDLTAILAAQVPMDRGWLRAAISRCYGPDHPWLGKLV